MAAASPPLLPTTVLPAAASTTATVSPAPTSVSSADANPAATRAFLARLLDSVKRALSGARPWPELIDRSALSRPESLSDATARLRKNLAYFRVNYAAIVALSLAASLLAHPFSLAALLALLAAWCFLYLLRPSDAPPLAAFGRTFSDRETLGGLIVASAFVVFLTSVGSLIFSALALGAAIRALSGARPWPELIDRSALSHSESLSDSGARLRKNLAYFRVNYAAIVALSLAASLLAHPLSLAALLALLAAWCFLYLLRPSDAPPLAAFGRTFSDRETLGGLIVASAFVIFLTSVGSLIFSALALGAAIVCAHGAFRIPEDLFLDEPDQANGAASVNLLSFITSATGGRV
uniref:PRA1 family protein n=1 Tax=Oryza meridionalis TaxID=40149 RepID=A0A0E0F1M1_9ORYZ